MKVRIIAAIIFMILFGLTKHFLGMDWVIIIGLSLILTDE